MWQPNCTEFREAYFLKKWQLLASCFFIFVFSIQLIVIKLPMTYSNCRSLVSEATEAATTAHALHILCYVMT